MRNRNVYALFWCLIVFILIFVPAPARTDITPMDYNASPTGGGVSPKSPHPAIRLEAQEVIIRLKPSTYTVDALFNLSNSGKTVTEWIGFPKNAEGRGPGPLGRISDFIAFAVLVNEQDVPFKDDTDLLMGEQKSKQKKRSRHSKQFSWLIGQATFPGHATTTIRVKYEANYDHCGMDCTRASYIYGTGGYWKDSIGKASFIVDETEQKGRARVGIGTSSQARRRLISENLVKYDFKDLEPDPGDSLFITLDTGREQMDDNAGLMHAAMNGRLEEVQAILKKGLDVNAIDSSGETPLMRAAWSGSLSVVKLLVENGADVNAQTKDGETALSKAMGNAWMPRGQVEAARFLVEKGAKPTTLAVAAFVGDMETARRFLAEGADPNKNVTTRRISPAPPTPLTAAATGGSPEMVKLLLEKGAQVDQKNEYGYTPLMSAASAGHAEALKALLAGGADINARDRNKGTALHHAVWLRGHVEAAKVLLDAGADINARNDPANRTALMHAAQGGQLPMVKLLLERKADVNARDTRGKTALSLAQGEDIEEIEQLLKAHGAKK